MTNGDSAFQVEGTNAAAAFTLKVHRGEGMLLFGMNWRADSPPDDFVGFAIEYKEPGGDRFFALKNRLNFAQPDGQVDPIGRSTRLSPIQKFRWVHFPRNAELEGDFEYRVTPVFMNSADELSYGEAQEVSVALRRETYPGQLNVAFTRGFVSSQAFVDRYESKGDIATLLPAKADDGLSFVPTHPLADEAYRWMGFEAREVLLDVLDRAIADTTAQVRVVAYELNEPQIVTRLEKLGDRLKVIVDDSPDHNKKTSAESKAAQMLGEKPGNAEVKREHMGKLQHCKTILVDGDDVKAAVCGSTNFSWRGLFVQANNAVVVWGEDAIKPFVAAFDSYWDHDDVEGFGASGAARPADLRLSGIDATIAFSPHRDDTAQLAKLAGDLGRAKSSLLYSLAFLYQTPGPVLDAITAVTNKDDVFVYGISDRPVGGLDLQKPDGNVAPVSPAALTRDVPAPFSKEPTGGSGIRMHHKFAVIDFARPTARVYLGSYNFSGAADTQNGENLVLVKDRRIAVAYAVEAVRLFDHYHFRITEQNAKRKRTTLALAKPPRKSGEEPWWQESYSQPHKILDRTLFT